MHIFCLQQLLIKINTAFKCLLDITIHLNVFTLSYHPLCYSSKYCIILQIHQAISPFLGCRYISRMKKLVTYLFPNYILNNRK